LRLATGSANQSAANIAAPATAQMIGTAGA